MFVQYSRLDGKGVKGGAAHHYPSKPWELFAKGISQKSTWNRKNLFESLSSLAVELSAYTRLKKGRGSDQSAAYVAKGDRLSEEEGTEHKKQKGGKSGGGVVEEGFVAEGGRRRRDALLLPFQDEGRVRVRREVEVPRTGATGGRQEKSSVCHAGDLQMNNYGSSRSLFTHEALVAGAVGLGGVDEGVVVFAPRGQAARLLLHTVKGKAVAVRLAELLGRREGPLEAAGHWLWALEGGVLGVESGGLVLKDGLTPSPEPEAVEAEGFPAETRSFRELCGILRFYTQHSSVQD
uniref:Uncharacterized protein n=1 Tax=Steinernema glaseri TaxID=37863 RepID=A0A1I7Z169_9BILA